MSTRERVPFSFARRFGVVVVDGDPNQAVVDVACKTKPRLRTKAELERLLMRSVRFREVEPESFQSMLSKAYADDGYKSQQVAQDLGQEIDLASLADSVPDTADLLEQEGDAPIVRLINAILSEAIRDDASDIHIETFEKGVIVRLRIDGVLREILTLNRELAPLLVSRIKVMARLDIAEKRVPQDGRVSLRIGGREIDSRISVLPTENGERVVLRLLDKQAGRLDLPNLGMSEQTLILLRRCIAAPHGIILVTGPTGSGKTTTLYAGLSEVNTKALNILTLEDPVEYNIEGIGQTQINTRTGLTFASGLRAILRQNPDVVMVGEIRDLETAEIAVQASLTGHLVLSTLHTNTAVGTITRLVDMGVEPFLIASSLVASLAQRLVRVLCTVCRTPYRPEGYEKDFLGSEDWDRTIYRANGCEYCGDTGFRGRTGIYELIVVDETMRQLVHERASEQSLTDYARSAFSSIRDDGRQKVLDGVTSISEVMRVTLEG